MAAVQRAAATDGPGPDPDPDPGLDPGTGAGFCQSTVNPKSVSVFFFQENLSGTEYLGRPDN